MRRLARFLPWALLLWGPAALATGTALTVTEKPAPHQGKDMVCAAAVCSADLASTLHIVPSVSGLPGPGAAPAPGVAAVDLATQRQGLLDALDALKSSLELSRQILERVQAGDTTSAAVLDLSARFEATETLLVDALKRYVGDNAAQFQITATTDPARNREILRALKDIFPLRSGRIEPWIAAELRRLDAVDAARTAALRARSELLVRLGAFRVRKGVADLPLHLPGYDNIPARNLVPFDRIRFDLTDQEKQQLAEETKFNAEVIAKIEALRKEVQDNGNALKAVVAEVKTFADSLEKNLKAAGTDLETGAAGLAPSLAALRTSVDGLRQSIATLETTVQNLSGSLAVPTVIDPNRPDLALLQILGTLEPLQGQGGQAFANVLAQAKKVRDSATAVKAQLAAAPAEVRAKLQDAVQEALDAAAQDSGPLLSLLTRLQIPSFDKMKAAAQSLGAILTLQVGGAQRFDVAGDALQETDLQILRADAQPGDTIEIVLEIRRKLPAGTTVDDKPLYEERKSILVDVFGWSSGVATGIGFVKSIKEDLSNFKPAPIAVWRIRYRPRPESSGAPRFLGGLQPGIGIHVATVDFDPNASVEMGAGVAVHLFSDLVQIGYGWNLSVKKDRGYWYLGIGLFDLLRGK